MPRKGHSEEQIIYALRQAQAGKKVGKICRGIVPVRVRGSLADRREGGGADEALGGSPRRAGVDHDR
jgi:hypothetical protein